MASKVYSLLIRNSESVPELWDRRRLTLKLVCPKKRSMGRNWVETRVLFLTEIAPILTKYRKISFIYLFCEHFYFILYTVYLQKCSKKDFRFNPRRNQWKIMQNYKHELIDFVLIPKTCGWKLLFLEICYVRKTFDLCNAKNNTLKFFAWYLLKIAFSQNLAWTQNLLHNIKGTVQQDGSGEVVQYVISKVEALRYLAEIFTSLIIVL